ncbi:1204_t:CDS:1, partial [Rhizophagus irregularis]
MTRHSFPKYFGFQISILKVCRTVFVKLKRVGFACVTLVSGDIYIYGEQVDAMIKEVMAT